ncbi:polyprotein [Vanilla distortion mosaic virus]|uniref:Genome polyprotein n=2 Tax=Vanilla distortion mosaic virus TaxID=326202 RepID=A0A096XIR1_9POTV|nr:polyprotein [Vanilla distortion mosaic virus]AHU88030.1 polyprotein [Vanilla distortion mosaic virus]
MATTIQFGTFAPMVINYNQACKDGACSIRAEQMAKGIAPSAPPAKPAFDLTEEVFKMRPQLKERTEMGIVRIRKGVLTYKPKGLKYKYVREGTQNTRPRDPCHMEKETIPWPANIMEVSSISIGGGPAPSTTTSPVNSGRKPTATSRKQTRKVATPRTTLTPSNIDKLIQTISNIARRKGTIIEIVERRTTKCAYSHTRKGKLLRVETLHHKKKIRMVDVHIDSWARKLIQLMHKTRGAARKWNTRELTAGDSGLVIPQSNLIGRAMRKMDNLFIVRGTLKGQPIDARLKVHKNNIKNVVHYSNVAGKFWQGFDKSFQREREPVTSHTCESNFDVTRCGEVAAIICQALFPCGKITCNKCARDFESLTDSERLEKVGSRIRAAQDKIHEEYHEFTHTASTLRSVIRGSHAEVGEYELLTSVQKLIMHRKNAPFTHVLRASELSVKGQAMSKDEITELQAALLEIARYLNNRTENIETGSLHSFRNKISAKAHINPALMCDNQLDKNGNFVWGERGRHAKRFLVNFFDKIEPTRGYSEFVVRRNPNGSRRLAISNLIVSTNFETFREQIDGEQITNVGLTNACVSKINNNYEYTCCCVTHEDGRPVQSDFKMPTKNHLIVGNTGDPKYVDLPTDISANLYIAKEGYCYVNIFMAMLVNVNEADAKDFTKMTRDTVIARLGKWPSMTDVATACYFLATFFPDVLNAELPRILVDHETKTMHVLDSFGSKDTGFHILKANTVKQILKFASNALDSEMKHYLVGGRLDIAQGDAVRLLIRGIYRPPILKEILTEEPHLIILGLISPSVVIEMHRSGALEEAVKTYVSIDTRTAAIFEFINQMAQQCTRAQALREQHAIIERNAKELIELLNSSEGRHISTQMAMAFLICIDHRRDCDKNLVELGFTSIRSRSIELLEKNYKQELEASWRELSWLEKFYAIRQSYARPVFTVESSKQSTRVDFTPPSMELSKRYFIHCREALHRAAHTACAKVKGTLDRQRKRIRDKCFSVVNYLLADLIRLVNILAVISIMLTIFQVLYEYTLMHRREKARLAELEFNANTKQLNKLYKLWMLEHEEPPTEEEFKEYITKHNPVVAKWLQDSEPDTMVVHQVKQHSCQQLEKVVAFVALVMMMFDAERSDCVYRTLNKFKGIMGSIDSGVFHQSIDDMRREAEDKLKTIDFVIDTDAVAPSPLTDTTFQTWWNGNIERNNTIPHYRCEGKFLEFTRATAASIAHEIAHSDISDYLIRGAVGSGKSTGLPFNLQQRGHVLLIEPTRPLVENVFKQLQGEPFYLRPTMRMRGNSVFGSSPVTIMTSGFALHYLAHNITRIEEYKFIIFDECHVNDSSAMAFRSLLHEFKFSGKVLKVSATPPGRETEFTTQHPVKIITEESLSYEQFARNQGTDVNSDVVKHGHNILVYVPSYNAVDTLSELLTKRGFSVTKVDGRTMKSGNVQIRTHGTEAKKHFVVATNIIENGVTLDIDVVVDFGTKIVATLDSGDRAIRYQQVSISYGERIQRLGRVGRFKEGTALRIGHTEKGLQEIPVMIATEAALYCFLYGLPVMTHNVDTSIIGNCTLRQVRTMSKFELPLHYTCNLVRYDGTMHPAIHSTLKRFILNDAEILLNKQALPYIASRNWLTAGMYDRLGFRNDLPPATQVPFWCKDVPEQMHERIWEAITTYKSDVAIQPMTSHSACKIAYTLRTDYTAIERTIAAIDQLIADEQTKKAYFTAATEHSLQSSKFSLQTIITAVRTRYATDHTGENIRILQNAKAQILDFKNLNTQADLSGMDDEQLTSKVKAYKHLEHVHHQGRDLVKSLGLKGRWNRALAAHDLLITVGVAAGCGWMLYEWFMSTLKKPVFHQAKGKRQAQKLKFRESRDKKVGYVVEADDKTIEHFFGEAYTKKGKTKGSSKTRGMGTKNRKFTNMYGYDPADYSFVRFVDPLTGYVIEDSPYTDINLIQEEFTRERLRMLGEDEIEMQHMQSQNTIQAYFIKNLATDALKVDLTPHRPLAVGNNSNSIAGFPERENELRQTGHPIIVPATQIPKMRVDTVSHESKSLFRGLRDYNPIASMICHLTNTTTETSLHGVGYGSLIITNKHLFRENNGELVIRSRHGEFIIRNTCTIKMKPVPQCDLVVLQMPKDFPPFPQRLIFRHPIEGEGICMVGSNFQNKSITSTISESSKTYPLPQSKFWKHWISTTNGQCGLPLVSTRDGNIVGIHSLASFNSSVNYYAVIHADFQKTYLDDLDAIAWQQHWKYNPNEICWGGLKLQSSQPDSTFRISKLINDLDEHVAVHEQAGIHRWVGDVVQGNLQLVASSTSQLVTKHSVEGKCPLFEVYLQTHEREREFFTPLLGAYGKSRLNREAFIKDIMKYSKPTVVGDVDHELFQQALEGTLIMLKRVGMDTCNYITDTEEIISSLNMKSAVGAQYTGKKRDYFSGMTDEQKDELLMKSCLRLFKGEKGLWNGSLKAELRPMEKVNMNKTRVFTAAPLDTLLGGKVCVDDFNNKFYSLNLSAPWSVGMTKFHKGWDTLLNALPDGWLYCDADGSQFDSSLTPYLINAVLELRMNFMEGWDIGEVMLRNLYTEIIYTPILTPDGSVIKKCKGNNSGQPSTVVDNTLMVILAMRYALLAEGIPNGKQDDICRYFVNGDDLIIAVAPEHEGLYDGMQARFAQLGLNYDFSSRTRNKTELWFMSHQGVLRDGIFIPKLERERVVSILEWSRSAIPEHRLEAICAAMVEAWGYDDLVHEIRKFYAWVLEQAPYNELAQQGKAPYISEVALKSLYTSEEATESEIQRYLSACLDFYLNSEEDHTVFHQGDKIDAGSSLRKDKEAVPATGGGDAGEHNRQIPGNQQVSKPDRDVNVGTSGTFPVPRIKTMTSKMRMPRVRGKTALNLDHLLLYVPDQLDLSNTRATQKQFDYWYDNVSREYEVDDSKMQILLNGLMVWCIENGTSPNIAGEWVMMDGTEQVTFPIKPLLEYAQPTFRQIMAHFSNVAEAYIEMRNMKEPYMPRYGRMRNLNDMSLARYAFDFYEITSKTPSRAREAHMQMKAAALHGSVSNMFGLDGNVATTSENTERHTASDVSNNMHSLLGMRM